MKLISVIAFCVLLTCVAVANPQTARPLSPRINQPDRDGYTPLMRAAERGQVNVARVLLKNGAVADAKHPAGITALMFAAEKGRLQVVKLLLAAGADPNISVLTPHAGEVSPLIWGVIIKK
jgi:ankyrin repeat protein